MNKRIAEAFANGKAFIPFLTCGDPSLEVTEQLVYAMEEAGADLIELGIPFSDPTAEGPVIQAANVRALSGGVTTDKIFDMVKQAPTEYEDSDGVHDVCECGLFLWYGALYPEGGQSWYGRPDSSGCAVRGKGGVRFGV